MLLCFSGTRYGMTLQQKLKVKEFILKNKNIIKEIRHGDERGVEEEFHDICTQLGMNDKIYVHPSTDRTIRALCKSPNIVRPYEIKHRRTMVINESDFLLCASHNYEESSRLGVWSYVRLARKFKLNHLIIYPDGNYDLIDYLERKKVI